MKAYRNIVIAVVLCVSTALLMGCGTSNTVRGGAIGSGGGTVIRHPAGNTGQVSVSLQLFYDELSPYGSWVEYQDYGYVWVPDVDREFSPYGTDGHWVFTDAGWMWVSDYSWGWAPFHYGRWAYDDSYGWLWVPNNEWGPAWVTWRRSEGYYGWAPMGPSISIEVSFGGGNRVPNERWIFVSDRYISSPDINRYYVDRSTNVTIINNSTVINNTYIDNSRHTTYVAGPGRDDVQKVTGTAIRPVAIRENDRPGQTLSNDQLQIYRPRVETRDNNDRKPVPLKLVRLQEVRPVSERKPGNHGRNDNQPAHSNEQSAQPPNANPPEKDKVLEQPAQPPNARPSDRRGRDQQPPVVNPPEKNKVINESAQPSNIRPSDRRGRDQQPPVVNPPEKKKSEEVPIGTQTVNPSDNKGKGQQPRIVNPLDKNIDQQSKTRNNRLPNKKGKVRNSQPEKPHKQEQDSSKSSQRKQN
jgi:hypothetical protein